MHHHFYLSTECGATVAHKLFADSVRYYIVKEAAICENVLGVFSIEKHLRNLLFYDKKNSQFLVMPSIKAIENYIQ